MFRTPSLLLLAPLAAGCVGAGLAAPAWAPAPPPPEGSAPGPREREVEALLARESLDADDLVRLAEELHPDLAAAGAAVGEAAGRQWQATIHPNPALELESADVPSDRISLGRGANSAALVFPLAPGGRRGHEAAALGREREAAEHRRERVRRSLEREVRGLVVEVLFLRRAEAEAAAALEGARGVLELARTRLEARAATEATVARLRIEVEGMAMEREALARRRPVLAARLSALLGGRTLPLDHLRGDLPADLPAVDPGDLPPLERHPLLREGHRSVQAARERVRQREAEGFPDLDLRVAYGREPAARGNFVEAGIAFPLPLHDRGQGRILEAEFALARARRELQSAEGEIRTAVAAALARHATARADARSLHDRVVPDADRALEGTREAWRAGRAALADLLDAQRTAARARRSLLESIRDALLAREALRELLGELPGEEETR